MVRENFANFDGTNLSRDEIVNRIKSQGYDNFHFKVVATSSGLYGVNGAIIDVIADNDTPDKITTFALLSRSMSLFEFI